jgi:cytidyltransferase-like protein
MDGCFDMLHYGHANALRQAKAQGDTLVVGLVNDEEIVVNKGTPPVMCESERYAALAACKFVDEVLRNAPYNLHKEWVDTLVQEHGITYILHGDDPCLTADGQDAYAYAKQIGVYKQIKRTEGVSTTDIVGRMLLMTREHHVPPSAIAVEEEGSGASAEEGSGRTSPVSSIRSVRSSTLAKVGVEGLSEAQQQELLAVRAPGGGGREGEAEEEEEEGEEEEELEEELELEQQQQQQQQAEEEVRQGQALKRRSASATPAVPAFAIGGASAFVAPTLRPASARTTTPPSSSSEGGAASASASASSSSSASERRGRTRRLQALLSQLPSTHSRFLPTARRIMQFAEGRVPSAEDRVVYMPGSWDVFNPGHIAALAAARQQGTFLLVGIYDDTTINKLKGHGLPILNLYERALSLLSCK